MKRKRDNDNALRFVPPVLQSVYRYPTRYRPTTTKQALRLISESCLRRALETALEYHREWRLCAETRAYLLGRGGSVPESRERCWAALSEIGCVPWMGKWRSGAPVVWGFGSRSCKSARCVLHEWFVGAIPHGHTVRMVCGERGCTNPAHMYTTEGRGGARIRGVSTMARMVEALKTMVLRKWRRRWAAAEAGAGGRRVIKVLIPRDKLARIQRFEAGRETETETETEGERGEESLPPLSLSRKKGFDRGDASEDEEWSMEEWMGKLQAYNKEPLGKPEEERACWADECHVINW